MVKPRHNATNISVLLDTGTIAALDRCLTRLRQKHPYQRITRSDAIRRSIIEAEQGVHGVESTSTAVEHKPRWEDALRAMEPNGQASS
jgi:hypothetical protein